MHVNGVAQVRVQVAYRLGGQEWRSIILTAFKSFEAALNWLDPFVSPPYLIFPLGIRCPLDYLFALREDNQE
jgi:hypothetical protein